MKHLLFLAMVLIIPVLGMAQKQTHDFGSCFNKANRKSIHNKMENLMTRVSEETNCPKDSLTYTVEDSYTGYYSKGCRYLPKRITFNVCGEKRTYVHEGLSGNITYWLLGGWSLAKPQ
jgi:hypothetical protein